MREAIKVGVIADQTGDLSVMGVAQANIATLVVDEINASGGLLGRRVELLIEDSATDDAQAATAASKLVQEDHVDVILGGIFSSTRQAIKGPAVVEGETLYIYPEQYEGQEYHPLLFCTGAVPAQQVDPLVSWLMKQTGARTFYLPSADYIWPHVMNRKVHEVASANGGEDRRGGVLPCRARRLGRDGRQDQRQRRGRRLQHDRASRVFPVPRGALRVRVHKEVAGSSRRTSRRTSPARCRPITSRGCTRAWTTTSH